jgi:thioredoxin 1
MSDFNEIIGSNKPTLVDFYAEWCGPCKMLSPIIEKVKEQLGEEATILKVDVDKNPEAAQKFGIRGVPTLILFKEGNIEWRRSGVIMEQDLVNKVKEFV